MYIDKIAYKGKEVVYVDYFMKSPEEIDRLLEEAIAFVCPMKESGEKFLFLLDVRSLPITELFAHKLMEIGKVHIDAVEKSAIIGVTGIKKMFFKTYLLFSKSKMKAFNSKVEALDYLAS